MRRLGLSPGEIDIIVFSHGHWDHVTGMDGLVRRLGSASMPVLIHPAFWTRRRLAFPGRGHGLVVLTGSTPCSGAST
jgi:7,8-dihydropterin-6-yl-methyl-4-(beta-D-ribofuranosyl)aminobenzene 5'-phosphate synthase